MFWQGLTNLGGIVGTVLAICITGPLTDWGTVWLARRNQGVYEPEFRIVFVGAMLFGVFGYAGWAGTKIVFLRNKTAIYSIRTFNPQLVVHRTCLGSERWPVSRSSISHCIYFDLILYYFQHDKFWYRHFGNGYDHISFGHSRPKYIGCLCSDKLYKEHGFLWVFFFRERDSAEQRYKNNSFDLGRLSSVLLSFVDPYVPVW